MALEKRKTRKSKNTAIRGDIFEWLHRLESIACYFAFENGAYCPNLRLTERLVSGSDEWLGAGNKGV